MLLTHYQAPAPQIDRIPKADVLGVTVILLTCSYREQEFIRVGYYVSVYYDVAELNENPPSEPDLKQLVRHVVTDKPRVTRFEIPWGKTDAATTPAAAAAAVAE
jgi:histone chaperone ASF1